MAGLGGRRHFTHEHVEADEGHRFFEASLVVAEGCADAVSPRDVPPGACS